MASLRTTPRCSTSSGSRHVAAGARRQGYLARDHKSSSTGWSHRSPCCCLCAPALIWELASDRRQRLQARLQRSTRGRRRKRRRGAENAACGHGEFLQPNGQKLPSWEGCGVVPSPPHRLSRPQPACPDVHGGHAGDHGEHEPWLAWCRAGCGAGLAQSLPRAYPTPADLVGCQRLPTVLCSFATTISTAGVR